METAAAIASLVVIPTLPGFLEQFPDFLADFGIRDHRAREAADQFFRQFRWFLSAKVRFFIDWLIGVFEGHERLRRI